MNNELYEKLNRLQWLLHKQQMHGYHHGGQPCGCLTGSGANSGRAANADGISTKGLSLSAGAGDLLTQRVPVQAKKGGYITRVAFMMVIGWCLSRIFSFVALNAKFTTTASGFSMIIMLPLMFVSNGFVPTQKMRGSSAFSRTASARFQGRYRLCGSF